MLPVGAASADRLRFGADDHGRLQIGQAATNRRIGPQRSEVAAVLAPGREATRPLRDSSTRNLETTRKTLQSFLPNRFAETWLDAYQPSSFTNASLQALENQLHGWRVTPAGSEGYTKAEVTAGGVDTRELSSKTMESQKVPGLFFIGEVVDVTGQLGCFNFQWAWASAAAAARSL